MSIARSCSSFGLATLILTACTPSGDGASPEGAAVDVSALETAPVAAPVEATSLRRQFVRYRDFRSAVEEIALKRDGTYLVLVGTQTFTGTWAFDQPTMKVTLTPAAGQEPAPEPVLDVLRENCDPAGWIPTLTAPGTLIDGSDKLIPWNIDPEFARQRCRP